jgi:hypothetical protein
VIKKPVNHYDMSGLIPIDGSNYCPHCGMHVVVSPMSEGSGSFWSHAVGSQTYLPCADGNFR